MTNKEILEEARDNLLYVARSAEDGVYTLLRGLSETIDGIIEILNDTE